MREITLDKLAAIKIGDAVTYQHEGVTLRGEVHGWRLTVSRHEHHAIVGSSPYGYEHEVSLRSILSRERLLGSDQGTVIF